MATPKGWLTARDAADIWGVTVQRVHQLVEAYDLEKLIINPRMKLIKESEVHRFAKRERRNGVHASRNSR